MNKGYYHIFALVISFLFQTNNIQSQGSWTGLATLPNPAAISTMAACNGKIYVLSGRQGTAAGATYEYNPDSNTWKTKSTIPHGCFWASAVTVGNKIYVMGGGEPYPGNVYNYIYQPDSDKWTTGASLLSIRMYHSAVAVNGKIYLIGGQNGDGASEWYFDEYNTLTNQWARKAQLLNNGAWYCGVANIGDHIFRIAGGGYSSAQIKNHFDEYNISNDIWTEKTKFHMGLHAPWAVTYNNKIYLMGGQSNGQYYDSVWVYDTISDKWSAANFKLREPRSYHKAAIIDDCIYVYGGQNSSGTLDGSLTRYCLSASVEDTKKTEDFCRIYPNPSEGEFNIEILNSPSSDVEIKVLNFLGQEVINYRESIKSANQKIRISLDDGYSKGIYFIQVSNGNSIYSEKLLVK